MTRTWRLIQSFNRPPSHPLALPPTQSTASRTSKHSLISSQAFRTPTLLRTNTTQPPISLPRPQPVPALNPKSFDRHAAYRFSLAFQCVVNIGVRGLEPIRSRVVQAGTLEVVGCILEAWLASKGFAVGPNANTGGYPRESREQRHQRRQQQLEQRQRDAMDQVARTLTDAERLTVAEVSRVHCW